MVRLGRRAGPYVVQQLERIVQPQIVFLQYRFQRDKVPQTPALLGRPVEVLADRLADRLLRLEVYQLEGTLHPASGSDPINSHKKQDKSTK